MYKTLENQVCIVVHEIICVNMMNEILYNFNNLSYKHKADFCNYMYLSLHSKPLQFDLYMYLIASMSFLEEVEEPSNTQRGYLDLQW